jgi:hypothetical protein
VATAAAISMLVISAPQISRPVRSLTADRLSLLPGEKFPFERRDHRDKI